MFWAARGVCWKVKLDCEVDVSDQERRCLLQTCKWLETGSVFWGPRNGRRLQVDGRTRYQSCGIHQNRAGFVLAMAMHKRKIRESVTECVQGEEEPGLGKGKERQQRGAKKQNAGADEWEKGERAVVTRGMRRRQGYDYGVWQVGRGARYMRLGDTDAP